jgi:hypothetical protein
MDRLRSGGLSRRQDPIDDQIAFARRCRTNQHRLVGLAYMGRTGIGLRIDSDGSDAHAPRRADDPTGNFTAIGDKE